MSFLTLLLVVVLSIYHVSSYDLSSAQKSLIVEAHNKIRRKWGLTSNQLVWDDTLASGAKSHSDKCVYGHSGAPNLGENIAYQGTSDKVTPFPFNAVTTSVDDWNSEETDWTCSSNSCSGTCGHFTQNVWKETTKVGCGLSECTIGGWRSAYMVCRYSPQGNFNNYHPLNAPSKTPWCPGMPVTPPPTSGTVTPPPPTSGTVTPPPPTSGTVTPPPPTSGTVTPPPSGFSGCKVSCNGVASTCLDTPQIISGGVYCKCLTESMLWGVTNAGTTACTYWPSNVPLPLPYDKCVANFNNRDTFCTGKPSKYSDGKTYCPCGDPQGYSWPVKNLNTAACPYTGSAMDEASVSDTSSSSTLSTGQWVGICIGIMIVALIVIIIVVITMKKRREELI
eukprot:TRINITY_DN91_c0_g1_i1.p1 TRINITY_DN91_c0_g1~~TRINITY_DN91_c0_g1_i1.p1  ORF type:complete len:392 (-),score=91.36 TRINITY_DN91_c0_g1_i1:260-1435(-)